MLVTINNNTWIYKNKNVTGLLQGPVYVLWKIINLCEKSKNKNIDKGERYSKKLLI